MSIELYQELASAINAAGGLVSAATMRQRWDALWRSKYPVKRLYDAGLNDEHIDTALRRMAKD